MHTHTYIYCCVKVNKIFRIIFLTITKENGSGKFSILTHTNTHNIIYIYILSTFDDNDKRNNDNIGFITCSLPGLIN